MCPRSGHPFYIVTFYIKGSLLLGQTVTTDPTAVNKKGVPICITENLLSYFFVANYYLHPDLFRYNGLLVFLIYFSFVILMLLLGQTV